MCGKESCINCVHAPTELQLYIIIVVNLMYCEHRQKVVEVHINDGVLQMEGKRGRSNIYYICPRGQDLPAKIGG